MWAADASASAAEESIIEDDGSLGGEIAAEALELLKKPSAEGVPKGTAALEWPTFGIVGEKQAALYYTSFLVFTALFLKNSAGAGRGQQALRKSASGSSR